MQNTWEEKILKMRGRKRCISYLLVIILVVNLFFSSIPAIHIEAKENGQPSMQTTEESEVTEESTEETIVTEETTELTTEFTTEETTSTQELNNDSFSDIEDFEILEETSQEVLTDEMLPCLSVNGNVVLTENMTVRYVFWSDKATLDLNGYTLTVTEKYTMDKGTLKLNGGLLKCEKDFNLTGKASLDMKYTNDHIIVDGNFMVSGTVVFKEGIIETKGDVIVNSLFKAEGNSSFIFSGQQKQTVQASDGSNFGHIIVQNYSADGLYIQGGFQYQTLEDNCCTITYADIGGIRGYILTEDVEFEGTFRLMTGTLDLNGYNLIVHGDFIQEAGTIILNGGNLRVEGDFRLEKRIITEDNQVTYSQSTGKISMINDSDYFYVSGDFYAQPSEIMNCSEGIIEVKGNVNISTDKSFSCNHLLLTGDQKQTIDVSKKQFY